MSFSKLMHQITPSWMYYQKGIFSDKKNVIKSGVIYLYKLTVVWSANIGNGLKQYLFERNTAWTPISQKCSEKKDLQEGKKWSKVLYFIAWQLKSIIYETRNDWLPAKYSKCVNFHQLNFDERKTVDCSTNIAHPTEKL